MEATGRFYIGADAIIRHGSPENAGLKNDTDESACIFQFCTFVHFYVHFSGLAFLAPPLPCLV